MGFADPILDSKNYNKVFLYPRGLALLFLSLSTVYLQPEGQ